MSTKRAKQHAYLFGKMISRMGIAGEGNEVVIPFSSVLIAEVLEK